MNDLIVLSPEVMQAMNSGQPVVALESTLITHGLPFPANIETAVSMEEAVRKHGAVPATVAILDGSIRVGLSRPEIEHLAALGPAAVRKCSRRDLPIVVGQRGNGATTVAGTMIIAAMAGIGVFATGGIGGVHRGHPEDISADLVELGHTPITVVCAGAKSILDLPRTLEVLETQGVPVIGYGTDELPAFYSRTSGLPVNHRVDSPEALAAIASARNKLGLQQGILVTVPVPEHAELPRDQAEIAIQQATEEADRQSIAGKDITPFVLGRVLDLTAGRSREANIALLINNAGVGADIAVAIAHLGQARGQS